MNKDLKEGIALVVLILSLLLACYLMAMSIAETERCTEFCEKLDWKTAKYFKLCIEECSE